MRTLPSGLLLLLCLTPRLQICSMQSRTMCRVEAEAPSGVPFMESLMSRASASFRCTSLRRCSMGPDCLACGTPGRCQLADWFFCCTQRRPPAHLSAPRARRTSSDERGSNRAVRALRSDCCGLILIRPFTSLIPLRDYRQPTVDRRALRAASAMRCMRCCGRSRHAADLGSCCDCSGLNG